MSQSLKTIKLSHTIISAWAKGDFEQAVAYYLGKPLPPTPAMELGKLKDEEWEKYITDHKELPDELGGGRLRAPVIQQKYRKLIPFSDEYQLLLSGVPDLVDEDRLFDFKCGRSEAIDYIERFQLDIYKLLLPAVRVGYYLAWNPYLEKLTVGIKFLNDSNAEKALEWVITYAGEIIDYLQANRLIIDYKESENA